MANTCSAGITLENIAEFGFDYKTFGISMSPFSRIMAVNICKSTRLFDFDASIVRPLLRMSAAKLSLGVD